MSAVLEIIHVVEDVVFGFLILSVIGMALFAFVVSSTWGKGV